MLSITDIVKSYNGNIVVNIPQLDIAQGEIIGLVGNNGAGKTTLFRLLLDLIRADKGQVLSKEKNVAASEDWKKYTAAYLDEGFLINYLTPEEYFYFIGKLHQLSRADVDEFLQNFTAFFDGNILDSGKYIRDLSKGNQFKETFSISGVRRSARKNSGLVAIFRIRSGITWPFLMNEAFSCSTQGVSPVTGARPRP